MSWCKKHNLVQFIRGHGIEIGALNNPLRLGEKVASVLYIDRADRESLIGQNPETCETGIRKPDMIADAEDLGPLLSDSQDFVIACHVLEHMPNPLKALLEIFRVLKPGGILYLSIPDKRFTFDNKRPITTLTHVIKDYKEGATVETSTSHYQEWVDLVELQKHKPLFTTVDEAKRYRIHFHVWVPESVPEMLQYLAKEHRTPYTLVDYYFKNGDLDLVFICRKAGDPDGAFPQVLREKYSQCRSLLCRIPNPFLKKAHIR